MPSAVGLVHPENAIFSQPRLWHVTLLAWDFFSDRLSGKALADLCVHRSHRRLAFADGCITHRKAP